MSTALDIPIKSVFAWCDSTIVLAWLDGNPKRYRTFVGNRTATILKTIPQKPGNMCQPWKARQTVPLEVLPRELLDHTLWWEGPIWLTSDPVQTPMQPSLRPLSTPELRVVTCNLNIPVTPEWTEGRYASYHKTITITAWYFHFVLNLLLKHRNQPRITTPHLTTTEVNRAEQHLLIRAQAHSFPNEVYQLQRDKSISHSSKLLALSPVIGKDGILRVGGRLSQCQPQFITITSHYSV